MLFENQHRHQVKEPFTFHVQRPTTVNRSLPYFSRKRIDLPRTWICRNDIHMTQQNDWTFRAIALESGDDVCPRRFVLEDFVLNSVLIEDGLEPPRRFNLITRWIRGVDAQVLLHQVNSHVLVLRPVELLLIVLSIRN